jgi:hypothetical protein
VTSSGTASTTRTWTTAWPVVIDSITCAAIGWYPGLARWAGWGA